MAFINFFVFKAKWAEPSSCSWRLLAFVECLKDPNPQTRTSSRTSVCCRSQPLYPTRLCFSHRKTGAGDGGGRAPIISAGSSDPPTLVAPDHCVIISMAKNNDPLHDDDVRYPLEPSHTCAPRMRHNSPVSRLPHGFYINFSPGGLI